MRFIIHSSKGSESIWYPIIFGSLFGISFLAAIIYGCYRGGKEDDDENANNTQAVNNVQLPQTYEQQQQQYYNANQPNLVYVNQPQWQVAPPNVTAPLQVSTNLLNNGEFSEMTGALFYFYQVQPQPCPPPNALPGTSPFPSPPTAPFTSASINDGYGHAMYLPRPPDYAIPVLGVEEDAVQAGHEVNNNTGNNQGNTNKPASNGKSKL